ncbi:MAG: peptidylprolyl isomerase [Myxococcota bacterium]
MKIKVKCFPALFILTLFLSAQAEIIDGIAAIVNGEVVTVSDIRQRLGKAALARFDEIPSGVMREKQLYRAYSDTLNELIEEALISAEAEKLNLSATESEVDRMIEDILAQRNLTRDFLEKVLLAEGVPMWKYRETMKKQIIRQKIMGMKIHSRVKIEDEDVKNYYAQNINLAKADKKVKVRHILLLLPKDATKEEVEQVYERMAEIRRRVLAGEDFAALAREYSDDPSKESGGELPEFSKGTMLPSFEKVALKLKKGEVSEIVRTEYGFHIIQCLDVSAPEILPLKEVYDKIRDMLFRERLEEELKNWIAELKREAQIEIKLKEP